MTEERESKKTSAAEVLTALRDEVHLMAARLDEVADFSRQARKALMKDAEAHRIEGAQILLTSMFQIHDVVYRHARDDENNEFPTELLKTIEGELARNGIAVLDPEPGDAHDSTTMKVLGTESAGNGEGGSIAKVHRCGFEIAVGKHTQLLRKAEVDVFEG